MSGSATASPSTEPVSRSQKKTERVSRGCLGRNPVPDQSRPLKTGDPVNLEKALRFGTSSVGILFWAMWTASEDPGKDSPDQIRPLRFEVDPGLIRYIVEKGSIAVDGISLTVNRCEKNRFYVNMIPHTAAGTTLGLKRSPERSISKRISSASTWRN